MKSPSEDDVLKMMHQAGFDSKQIRMLTFTSWRDGIDIERPTFAVMRFVDLMVRTFAE